MTQITKSLLFGLVLAVVSPAEGQLYDGSMRWCTINTSEQEKCLAFNETLVNRDNNFNVGFDAFFISCVQGADVDGCIRMVDQGQADLMTLDPGQVFIGGRYHNLVPIMQEQYKGDSDHYYAVAVVKTGSDIRRLADIRGKKACFPRVGDLAGWVLPITKLIAKGVMKIADCNNHVRSVSEFFGQSCAIGSLTSRYNPLGDNSNKLCELCGSPTPGRWCSDADPYANMEGALRCLAEAGDIAFLKHTTVQEVLATARRNGSAQLWEDGGYSTVAETPESVSESSFELLCLDGRRAPLSDHLGCNWGRVPSHAVVTSSTQSQQQRRKFQKYLQRAVSALGTRSSKVNGFSLFDSARYGVRPNLMFQDATMSLRDIPQSDQLYLSYLGPSEVPILDIHSCPIKTIRMCVTSLAEAVKCDQMRQALRARLLKPELLCTRPRSYVNCMREIYSGVADIAMLDAGDVYTAGLYFDLIPIMNEAYDKDKTFFYSVAVAKELDLTTDLLYLKNKFTCHTGVMQGAGWIIPMAYLISNQRIRGYGCDSLRAASQAFTKSCAPGALNSDYRMDDEWYNLCQLCHGSSRGYCARDADEGYYGHTGAFRCLVEGGGDVAFMKHTTVLENTDGKRKEFWSRNQLAADYQLLCRDGTRGRIQDFATCNIGKVRTNAMVTRGGSKRSDVEIDTILNLFMHAQQHFGQKNDNDFSFRLFHSDEPYADLIFSDAAQQILPLPKSEQHYRPYLGEQFLQARSVVDCHAGATALYVSIATVVMTTLLTRLLV